MDENCKSRLYEKLIEYSKGDSYPFHMPGHKRNPIIQMENPYSFDITEIDGFDNMHDPQGIIKEELKKASALYGCRESFFLINGSSGGNLAAISAVADEGDRIIIARNCHKSVYNAVELRKLKVEYIYPSCAGFMGSVEPDAVEEMLKRYPDTKAVVITSPTYEGVVSDVRTIADTAHKYGAALIVDAAHGAHFILGDYTQKGVGPAIRQGADIVIESLHKTLPSLTQTAILHYNSAIVDRNRLAKYLRVYQSSSPSYVLMASICNCLEMARNNGSDLYEKHMRLIKKARQELSGLNNFALFNGDKEFAYDMSKFVIFCNSMTGLDLAEKLRNGYGLEAEMAAPGYVILMTSPLDSDDGIRRLIDAMKELDKPEASGGKDFDTYGMKLLGANERVCQIHEATRCADTSVSKEYIYMYPPGIPLVVPGEIAPKEFMQKLEELKEMGFDIKTEI